MPDIYAVDFDGTICTNLYPKIGSAKKAVIDFLKERKEDGDKLILWTCRTGDALDAAVEWCKEEGIEFDAVNENITEIVKKFGGDCRKIYADYYLDDRNLDINAIEERGRCVITKDRAYRHFEVRAAEEGMIVEGYAATFEQETVMYEFDGIQYKEVIDRNAFSATQMSDVVMNFNHGGKPVARTKNSTLTLEVDSVGLRIKADLSGTEEGRKLYEEVKGGYIDKMSFAFTVSSEEYLKDSRTRRITGIKRLYDVAAVDIPAYDSTSISARSFFEAEAEREAAEAVEREKRRKKLKIMLELEA